MALDTQRYDADWTTDWPEEPGQYFCYWRFKGEGFDWNLELATVRRFGDGGHVYIGRSYLYKVEVHAFWCAPVLPKLPDTSAFTEIDHD